MLIVGIAGGTGSGKTTLVRHIAENLPAGMLTTVIMGRINNDL